MTDKKDAAPAAAVPTEASEYVRQKLPEIWQHVNEALGLMANKQMEIDALRRHLFGPLGDRDAIIAALPDRPVYYDPNTPTKLSDAGKLLQETDDYDTFCFQVAGEHKWAHKYQKAFEYCQTLRLLRKEIKEEKAFAIMRIQFKGERADYQKTRSGWREMYGIKADHWTYEDVMLAQYGKETFESLVLKLFNLIYPDYVLYINGEANRNSQELLHHDGTALGAVAINAPAHQVLGFMLYMLEYQGTIEVERIGKKFIWANGGENV